MNKIGAFVGKFAPPHRGHINSILRASTQCEKLYVIVSHHEELEKELYKGTPTKPISLKQKVKWLSCEFSDLDHIEVVALDETNIPIYPNGWAQWSEKVKQVVSETIDVFFGGEPSDGGNYEKYFGAKYQSYNYERTEYSISATEIRKDPFKYWDYILGEAREHFVKKVLIVGTESCGKTTLTKMLAKTFFTSWALEEGRYYSTKYFGGNDYPYSLEDFYNICWEQKIIEDKAIRTANKITFFDTDAIITQYYCELYMGETNPKIEAFVDPEKVDIVLMLSPDIKWVDDGFRFNSGDELRWQLHNKLKQMYIDRGYGDKIIEISGTYIERLLAGIAISKELLGEKI